MSQPPPGRHIRRHILEQVFDPRKPTFYCGSRCIFRNQEKSTSNGGSLWSLGGSNPTMAQGANTFKLTNGRSCQECNPSSVGVRWPWAGLDLGFLQRRLELRHLELRGRSFSLGKKDPTTTNHHHGGGGWLGIRYPNPPPAQFTTHGFDRGYYQSRRHRPSHRRDTSTTREGIQPPGGSPREAPAVIRESSPSDPPSRYTIRFCGERRKPSGVGFRLDGSPLFSKIGGGH